MRCGVAWMADAVRGPRAVVLSFGGAASVDELDEARAGISCLELQLDGFVSALAAPWRDEFEGLRSVLVDYVLQDLKDRSIDRGVMSLVIGAISQEVDRLVRAGLPLTQEFCAGIAQELEHLGDLYDDHRLRSDDPGLYDSAAVCYELAVVWYRVVNATYTGVLPVQSQLRVVRNLMRLGGLSRNRDVFRRAIRELFSLIDDDKFLALMTQRDQVRLTEKEREGLLAYRHTIRASVRRTMVDAITRLHELVPERLRAEYRTLEQQIVANQKGPADLLRFLKMVTVIPELKDVEGGRDWLVEDGPKFRYMNMLDHVEEVERALEALERKDYEYFHGRLVKEDRAAIDANSFQCLFEDVFDDYHRFTRRSGVSKLNFWLSLMLHDVGRILLESHHKGGALLVRGLLEALGIRGFRQESIVDYVRYHGQWKRFYLLENSPDEVIDYVTRIGEGNVPFMLLEKRRIESIVDLAATGEGRLALDFIAETKSYTNLSYLLDLKRNFRRKRLDAWGGMNELYKGRILPREREEYFDRYLNQIRIAHSHNLLRALPPENLLKFHYLCARIISLEGFSAQEARVTSDKLEDLQALNAALEAMPLEALRARLDRLSAPGAESSPKRRAEYVTTALLEDPGLLVEFKNDNETVSVNTVYARTALRRERGVGRIEPR